MKTKLWISLLIGTAAIIAVPSFIYITQKHNNLENSKNTSSMSEPRITRDPCGLQKQGVTSWSQLGTFDTAKVRDNARTGSNTC